MSDFEPDPQDLCPLVLAEWDRGHATTTGIVRAHTAAGLILTEIDDLSAQAGLVWISGNELLEVDNLDDDDMFVRIATLRGERQGTVDPDLTWVDSLVAHLADLNLLIMIFQSRTGSREGLVGRITRVRDGMVHLDEIGPDARPTGDPLELALTELISVEWGTDYLRGLTDLLEAG